MWLLSCLTTCQLPKMAWHLSGSLCKRGAQQAAFRQGQKNGKTQCWITMRRSLKGEINASWFCSHYNHAWDLHLGFHCGICFPNEIQSFRKLSEGSWSGPPPSWGGGVPLFGTTGPWELFTSHLSPGGCSITMVTRYKRHYGNKENRI